MKTAIVTGATSGIGLAITKKLIELDYHVFGLARNISEPHYIHHRLRLISCDVADIKALRKAVQQIKQEKHKGSHIDVLINNAGIGYFAPHEQLQPEQIESMLATNLQAPLILTQMLLSEIKQHHGWIINISSITAKKISTHGCAYAATKAGLSHFGASLFEEVRKSGAKVVTLHPDLTDTPFYDHLNFTTAEDPETYLTAECVADAVKTVLSQRESTVLTDITLRPQKNRIKHKSEETESV